MKRSTIMIILVVVVIIAFIGLILTTNDSGAETNSSSDYSIGAKFNDEEVVWYDSAKKALNNVEFSAEDESIIINFDATDELDCIVIYIDGQTSGYELAGSTDTSDSIGTYEPDDDDTLDLNVYFTTDSFESGEVVLVTVTFYESRDTLFEENSTSTTKYFAFEVL